MVAATTASASARAAAAARRATPRRAARGTRTLRARPAATAMMAPEDEKLDAAVAKSRIGLVGLAVMGQNLALNIAEKGFPISVYNRTASKVDDTLARAEKEGLGDSVSGYKDIKDFVQSLQTPRSIIILVKAGAPVDATIAALSEHLEEGDAIIDGGNEWYENTERRAAEVAEKGLLYLGMGVSGGEEGARNGPSMMPGGSEKAFGYVEDIVKKVAAQVDSGPCVTYVGKGGAGNFVKMVHNGIEYGDMQLISEAYDILKHVGGLSNDELKDVFAEWNLGELESYLIEITSNIFGMPDTEAEGYIVDKILDKTGMKGTGKWTVQQAAELSVAIPTIAAALDARFLSGLKEDRMHVSGALDGFGMPPAEANAASANPGKEQLIADVRNALYAAKIMSYTQGLNLIGAKSAEQEWGLSLGELARIWKGGCIIRAGFLDRIKQAYDRDASLRALFLDSEFAAEIIDKEASWRRVVGIAASTGVAAPAMSASLQYFDTYRRARMPANVVQAQRDYFGSHSYERTDKEGTFHTLWPGNSADSVTTTSYNA